MNNTFMFTIATNGYDRIFSDWLETQREYAERNGYEYYVISKSPPRGIDGANSAWLKIPMILWALRQGYEWVFFVDSDCKIQSCAPPVDTVRIEEKSIYMCHDQTQRFNGGVIIAKNDSTSIRLFSTILRWSDLPNRMLPKEDINLYENGHLIYFAKNNPSVATIDPKWNNTSGKSIGEYIWHGRGRYHQKPRSEEPTPNTMNSLLMRIRQGPRYLLLKRLTKFYTEDYTYSKI